MAQNDQHRCSECGVEFSTTEQLDEHNREHHQSEPMRAGQRRVREGNAQSGPQRVRPSDRNE